MRAIYDDTLPANADEAADSGWEFLSSGSYRQAFIHPDRPGLVLKIAHDEEMDRYANETEAEHYAIDPSHHLTPCLAARTDYRAVLMQRERYPVSGTRRSAALDMYLYDNDLTWDALGRNLASIPDDYGDLVTVRILDYASEESAAW